MQFLGGAKKAAVRSDNENENIAYCIRAIDMLFLLFKCFRVTHKVHNLNA